MNVAYPAVPKPAEPVMDGANFLGLNGEYGLGPFSSVLNAFAVAGDLAKLQLLYAKEKES